MSKDDIGKIIKYIQNVEMKIDKISEDMSTKKDVEKLLIHLDSIEEQLEISDDERLVIGHQLDRLNIWVKELADKIGYKLAL